MMMMRALLFLVLAALPAQAVNVSMLIAPGLGAMAWTVPSPAGNMICGLWRPTLGIAGATSMRGELPTACTGSTNRATWVLYPGGALTQHWLAYIKADCSTLGAKVDTISSLTIAIDSDFYLCFCESTTGNSVLALQQDTSGGFGTWGDMENNETTTRLGVATNQCDTAGGTIGNPPDTIGGLAPGGDAVDAIVQVVFQ